MPNSPQTEDIIHAIDQRYNPENDYTDPEVTLTDYNLLHVIRELSARLDALETSSREPSPEEWITTATREVMRWLRDTNQDTIRRHLHAMETDDTIFDEDKLTFESRPRRVRVELLAAFIEELVYNNAYVVVNDTTPFSCEQIIINAGIRCVNFQEIADTYIK